MRPNWSSFTSKLVQSAKFRKSMLPYAPWDSNIYLHLAEQKYGKCEVNIPYICISFPEYVAHLTNNCLVTRQSKPYIYRNPLDSSSFSVLLSTCSNPAVLLVSWYLDRSPHPGFQSPLGYMFRLGGRSQIMPSPKQINPRHSEGKISQKNWPI